MLDKIYLYPAGLLKLNRDSDVFLAIEERNLWQVKALSFLATLVVFVATLGGFLGYLPNQIAVALVLFTYAIGLVLLQRYSKLEPLPTNGGSVQKSVWPLTFQLASLVSITSMLISYWFAV